MASPKDFHSVVLLLAFFFTIVSHASSSSPTKSSLPKIVRVSTLLHAPYIQRPKPSSNYKYSGFLIDLMSELSRRLNFKIEFIREADTFGKLVGDQWTGVVDDVVKGKADIGLASLQMTPDRMSAVEYSIPIVHNGLVAIRRRVLPSVVSRSIFFCLEPFGAGVWISIFLILLLTTALLTVNSARNPRERAQRMARGELVADVVPAEEPLSMRDHLSQTAWYVLSTAALQSAPRLPMSVTGRILSLIWWLFAGLTMCAYIAALLMGIVVARGFPAPSFTTISELAVQAKSSGYRVFFVPPRVGDVFKNHADDNFRKLWAISQKSEGYLKGDASRGNRNTLGWANTLIRDSDQNILIIGSETARNIFKYTDCGTIVATEFVDDRYMSLVFPRNATELRMRVNQLLLSFLEEGRMHLWWFKWQLQGSGKCSTGFAMDDPSWIYRQADAKENTIAAAEAVATLFHDSVPIRFASFAGIFLLYIFGLVITGAALAADLYIYSRIERHKRGNQVLTNRGGQRRISDTPEFENFNEL